MKQIISITRNLFRHSHKYIELNGHALFLIIVYGMVSLMETVTNQWIIKSYKNKTQAFQRQ